MTEEWNLMRKDNIMLPSGTELMFSTHDEEIAYMNSIMEEIQASLKTEGNNRVSSIFISYICFL